MSRKNSIGSMRTNSTISVSSTHSNGSLPTNLHPCSASSQLVLYAQGSSVLCLQHDSLALERRFERHTEDVTVISVDNVSDTAPTRVVSVDKSRTAIVWDIESGEEISRYNAYEDILVASWMKNGNLVLGDALGNITLFDPARGESIKARTIFDPLCSIAPTADCKAFALGYNNGSILIAALSPIFTILHTLTTTSLAPSPVVGLAWHASSSKQKSDMLAVQTRDGDLRVWSVPKSLESEESARVVRILKRPEYSGRGNNWLGWSRNGRIVQYSAGSTTIWDVRTKNLTWDDVPTLGDVLGICIYGPKGALFTFGRDHTVQQFTLYPPQLVANIQHAPALPPPSPPVSIEERDDEVHRVVPSEDYMMSMHPMGSIAQELEQVESMEYLEGGLGISNVPGQRPTSVSSGSSMGSIGSRQKHSSMGSLQGIAPSGSEYSPATTVSPNPDRKESTESVDHAVPVQIQPSAPSRKGSVSSIGQRNEYSASPAPGRKESIGAAQPRKTHPLRQEYHPTPDTPAMHATLPSPIAEVPDIFANLRSRLNSVTYESPRVGGPQSRLSEDDLRKEMLYCIFGWQGDIEDLIGDELESVNARSLNSLILRLWLGDIDQNSLSVMLGADFAVSGDWLFLALSAMGGQNSWTHVARAFVLKLLQKGDLHMAVLCLLAIGDKNDAVEIYVSHKKFLEAVLLTSLLWKKDWKRISQLVRQWGQYASDSYDGTLAARCFACAGTEAPTERERPQRSRTPSVSRSKSDSEPIGSLARKLSISSPSNPRATLKMTPKNLPLKLITDFPTAPEKDPINRSQTTSPSNIIASVNRFFHGVTGPSRSANSTPIAMSALTPIDPFWAGRDPFPPTTRMATPAITKLTPVTEVSPMDRTPVQRFPDKAALAATVPPPPPPPPPAPFAQQTKISSPVVSRNSSGFSETVPVTLADVQKMERVPTPPRRNTPPQINPPRRMASPPIRVTSPVEDPIMRSQSASIRGKPAGLKIQFPPMDLVLREGTPAAEKGHRRTTSRVSPPVPQGRFPPRKGSGDLDFLDLIEKGNKRLDEQRAVPRGMSQRRGSPGRSHPRNMSQEREPRGRTYEIKKSHQRSPSSPLPFSPQAALYRDDPVEVEVVQVPRSMEIEVPPMFNEPRYDEHRGRSARRDRSRRRSPSPQQRVHREEYDDEDYLAAPRNRSRGASRSPRRGRVQEIKGSHIRSPSSPLPMSPQALLYKEMSEEVDRQHEEDERRSRRNRSRVAQSQTRGHPRMDSRTRGPQFQNVHNSGLRRSRSERTLRQWSEQLEHGGNNYTFSSRDRGASPNPSMLSRQVSTRGLPSNPKAWRAELQANSRANSPAPARGRSPAPSLAMAPAPPPPGQRTMSPAPRSMTPAARLRSPPPVGRTMSPAPVFRGMSASVPPPPTTLGNLSMAPAPAPYESVPPLPAMAMAPAPAPYESVPPLPAMVMAPQEAPYESVPTAHLRNMSPAPARDASRIRNMAMSPAPPPPPPPAPREREPSRSRRPTPAPLQREMSRRGRSHSRPGRESPPNPYYASPSIDEEYESPPPLPSLQRSNSHMRNNSEPTFKPLIRKLPPMPLSPPPLPMDFPVHQALQMHLEPGKKKTTQERTRSVRRPKKSVDFTPEPEYTWQENAEWGGGDYYDDRDYHDDGYRGQYADPELYYEEMNQMEEEMRARRAMSPTPSTIRGAGGVNMI